jgi:hypothetical protein
LGFASHPARGVIQFNPDIARVAMLQTSNNPIAPERNLTLAVIAALQMWSDKMYEGFLHKPDPSALTEDWFRWFMGEWKVARTIKRQSKDPVRLYFDRNLREALRRGGRGAAVDSAAAEIRRRKWSAQSSKDGQGSLPISIVSKIGFFLCPGELIPMDRFAAQGLNRIRRSDGERALRGRSYQEYLASFNEKFEKMSTQMDTVMNQPWVSSLAKNLGCPGSALETRAIRRKVFDNYLMHLGDYLERQRKEDAS